MMRLRFSRSLAGRVASALAALFVVGAIGGIATAANITGDPVADGWNYGGHSLQNGVYATGSANYGFDTYSAGIIIQAGSNLEIDDGDYSWLAGDTVLGVGGVFQSITPAEAGWGAFTGNSVNSLLSSTSGPKLQVKFGTANATWTTSTAAPGSGDGVSGSSSGGGRIQVRTSGFFQAGTPNPLQDEPWTWDGNSGQLLVLDKQDHVSWDGDPNLDKRVARMIWIWDDVKGEVSSWQLLLNVSLIDRLYPSFAGLLPAIGDKAIMTVQDGGGPFTDALITIQPLATSVVPEPSSTLLALMGIVGLGGIFRRKNGATA